MGQPIIEQIIRIVKTQKPQTVGKFCKKGILECHVMHIKPDSPVAYFHKKGTKLSSGEVLCYENGKLRNHAHYYLYDRKLFYPLSEYAYEFLLPLIEKPNQHYIYYLNGVTYHGPTPTCSTTSSGTFTRLPVAIW